MADEVLKLRIMAIMTIIRSCTIMSYLVKDYCKKTNIGDIEEKSRKLRITLMKITIKMRIILISIIIIIMATAIKIITTTLPIIIAVIIQPTATTNNRKRKFSP